MKDKAVNLGGIEEGVIDEVMSQNKMHGWHDIPCWQFHSEVLAMLADSFWPQSACEKMHSKWRRSAQLKKQSACLNRFWKAKNVNGFA